mgnify:FL=1
MYTIAENTDYKELTYLFYDNGLEITPGIERPSNVVKCWSCRNSINQDLIGGASLEMRNGHFVVADVAVNIEFRQKKIGTRLMNLIEEEIIKRGGNEAWLVAKAPNLYIKLGWEVVTREQAPDISKCFSCIKYGKECNPQILHKRF